MINNTGWIEYPRARAILERMESMCKYPKAIRMPSLFISSIPGNGKSFLLKHFQQTHSSVIYVSCPSDLTEKAFFEAIIAGVQANSTEGKISANYHEVLRIIQKTDAKVLILDGLDGLVNISAMKQKQFLNLIKSIYNELQIVIIASGRKETGNLFLHEPQLANRFEPAMLTTWQLNQDYFDLLKTFSLQDPALAGEILNLSDGSIGQIILNIKKYLQNVSA